MAKIKGDFLSEVKTFNVLGPLHKTLKHAFMYVAAGNSSLYSWLEVGP